MALRSPCLPQEGSPPPRAASSPGTTLGGWGVPPEALILCGLSRGCALSRGHQEAGKDPGGPSRTQRRRPSSSTSRTIFPSCPLGGKAKSGTQSARLNLLSFVYLAHSSLGRRLSIRAGGPGPRGDLRGALPCGLRARLRAGRGRRGRPIWKRWIAALCLQGPLRPPQGDGAAFTPRLRGAP